MDEVMTVEWPSTGDMKWRPMSVILVPVSDAWAHRIYSQSTLMRDVPSHRRPRNGVVILDELTGFELGLIVRMTPDPRGERLNWVCTDIQDSSSDDSNVVEPEIDWERDDYLVESRRWIPIRGYDEYAPMRATATRAQAVRDCLLALRETEPSDADLVGDDLAAMQDLS